MRKTAYTFLCLAISPTALPVVSRAASFTGVGFLPGESESEASAK
ncbi:MAG TPA: hypothetical protein VKM54_09700 [Myxococcota bacterium]|nr:hypothetical protein [Myxococcota bacterium]